MMSEFDRQWGQLRLGVNVYESIMQGLSEAVEYQHGRIDIRIGTESCQPL
jgi:hypothetical protein